MSDQYSPTVQRSALLKLVEALGCREAALRRDECGDWRINGNYGYIYAVPGATVHGSPPGEGFYLYCAPGSPKAWTYAKRALEFCAVTQDGDEEGFLFLARLPTSVEAGIIRDKLGIPKKKVLSEDHLRSLREAGSTHAFQPRRPPT